jgi:hypothetical protein
VRRWTRKKRNLLESEKQAKQPVRPPARIIADVKAKAAAAKKAP